ncbi:voltage-dependent anion channel [Phellopilus nigrolimitatus]|nr:voltage-dependent anion channel [Phellopilus nigrolimitatus]
MLKRQDRNPLKERIRRFTPAWHSVNMGTGAISILFHNFPYGTTTRGMQSIAFFFLLLNLALFIILTIVGATRYTAFRNIWATMIHHPVASLYLGTFPMGFATIIIAAVGVVYKFFDFGGKRLLYGLWGLWWFDVALSLVICLGQLHIMFTRQKHEVSAMTMLWLLPIVTLTVSSSAGAIVAQALVPVDTSHACLSLAVCMTLVTVGMTLALAMFTIYLQRLIVHGLPEGTSIFSVFLPIGALGQGGYACLVIGEICEDLFPLASGPSSSIFVHEATAQTLYVVAWVFSFALWGLATCWFLLALLALGDTLIKGFLPFQLSFWGMIFPNGVYANLTIQLAGTIDCRVLRIWGSICACFTLALWIFAVCYTLPAVWDGSIFESPCLTRTERAETMTDSEGPVRHTASHEETGSAEVMQSTTVSGGSLQATSKEKWQSRRAF